MVTLTTFGVFFWELRIFLDRLNQETSNLARRRMVVSSNEENVKSNQNSHVEVTWSTFEILGRQISRER